jgi:outer membrane murein-binding lipoprotein Lpp
MKTGAIAIGLSIVALSTGCQDARVTRIEQRVDRLEQNVNQLESEHNSIAQEESARRAKLETCVADANTTFDKNVVSNGTRTRSGTHSLPVASLNELTKEKKDKIEECKLLYSK